MTSVVNIKTDAFFPDINASEKVGWFFRGEKSASVVISSIFSTMVEMHGTHFIVCETSPHDRVEPQTCNVSLFQSVFSRSNLTTPKCQILFIAFISILFHSELINPHNKTCMQHADHAFDFYFG